MEAGTNAEDERSIADTGSNPVLTAKRKKTMHILDFLMYFPIMGFIWWLIGKLSNGELTNELGALIGIIIILICTIIYVILFTWYPDLN